MEFITQTEVTAYLIEQAGLWDFEDLLFAVSRRVALHTYLNSLTFFELDTREGDQHIEEWLESEKLLCSVFN